MFVRTFFKLTYSQVWIKILFLSILVFAGCVDRKQFVQSSDLPAKLETNVQFKLEKTTIKIANDTNDKLLAYFTFSNNVDSQKIISITKNYYLNIVDVKNCTTNKVQIPTALKNTIKRTLPVVQFCQCNDSIYYFLLKDTLVNWNIKNSALDFRKLILPVDFNSDKYYLSTNSVQNFGFPMYYKDNTLYFESFPIDKRNKIWALKSENYPFQINYDLKGKNSLTNKIDLPDFAYENHYGLRFEINRLNTEKGNIISFPFSGNLYFLQNDIDSPTLIGGRSIYQTKGFIHPICSISQKHEISNDSDWYYFTHNEYYGNLIFNTNTHQFYRLFYHEIPLKKKDGFYSTNKDRVISVQIFNEQYSLVSEKILDDINFILEFMPYKNGFLINNNGIDFKKDHYEYLYYEVKPE